MRHLLKATIVATFLLAHVALALPLNQLKLPAGFAISIYAQVPDARSMTLGKNGIVYVGTRELGKVYALIPNKDRSKAKAVHVIAQGLAMPNGVAYYQGDLYVAQMDKISKYVDITTHLKNPKAQLMTNLPNKRWHGWRYIKFGPDGWLYVAIGAPCNVCVKKSPFATIMRMRPNGTDQQIYATGVRNSVGFDWNPLNHKMWFTDNGRDWLGNNRPPDELNYAPHAGMNFGFPYYYGKNIPDPRFGKLKSSKGMTPAAQDLGPHVATLGMSFYKDNQIIIAEHGSWNRSKKIGYRLTLVRLKGNQPVSYQPFVTGWLQGQSNWGRPVDILVMPDRSLLVSDDEAGVVYRITSRK